MNRKHIVISDILSLILTIGPVSLTAWLSYFAVKPLQNIEYQILVFPFVVPLCFIFVCGVIRLFLPRVRQGVHLTGFNLGFIAWWSHSLLMRASRISGLHYVLHSQPLFRFLYWRAMGAKVPYNISTSNRITLHDFQMLSIGEGCIFSEDTEISAHLIRGDKILVAPVTIGKNVFVGRETYIGPRTRIGDGAWIGPGQELAGKVIAPDSKLP